MENNYSITFLVGMLSLSGIVASVAWALHNRKQWGYILLPLFFFLNAFLFTVIPVSQELWELWEGILVLHALLLLLSMVIVMPLDTARKPKWTP
jgi:uncharacterized membrane protein YagU involved in acid resistance